MNRLIQPFHSGAFALVAMLALALALSACGKKEGSGAASTPGAPVAGPAPTVSSPASGLPASQLGSMPTTGGSKNSTGER